MAVRFNNYNPSAPKKDARRQMQGRRNYDIGITFENHILAACDTYKRLGLAYVDKTPEPFKILGSKKPNSQGIWVFEGFFTKPAQPDFQGTLRGGRSIVFEAKTSQGDQIKREKVTKDQENALELHGEMGALAFVFVSVKLRQSYRVPWSVWRDMKQIYGRQYMTVFELEPFKLKERNGIILLFDGVTK